MEQPSYPGLHVAVDKLQDQRTRMQSACRKSRAQLFIYRIIFDHFFIPIVLHISKACMKIYIKNSFRRPIVTKNLLVCLCKGRMPFEFIVHTYKWYAPGGVVYVRICVIVQM